MAQGVRTDPEIEEAVYAYYVLKQNYGKTGRHFGLPRMTVVNIVDRLKTDDLVKVRHSMRADLAQRFWDRAGRLVSNVSGQHLGSEHTSLGSESAKAIGELCRAAALLEPEGIDDKQRPAVINVYTSMPPPPELQDAAVVNENTTSTLGKLS